ncbi:MAG: hypothetical protein WA782_16765 [Sulfitobacter sp.]
MTDKAPKKRNTLGVEFSGSNETGQQITLTTADALKKVFRTEHDETANGLLRHCFKVLSSSEVSDDLQGNDERLFMLNSIEGIAPRNGIERLLAVQMSATHVAMVRSAGRLANAVTLEQFKVHYSGYTKLARTYTAQMEALRKHRNGGKQTVVVQHVNVEDGGKAIVANLQGEK